MSVQTVQRNAAETALYHVMRGCRVPTPMTPAEKRAKWLQSLKPGDPVRYVMPAVSMPGQIKINVTVTRVSADTIRLSNRCQIDRSTGIDRNNPNAGIIQV